MILEPHGWSIQETSFAPAHLNHSETVFTIGNGYLGSRGVVEEGYPGEVRSTFIHGMFDDVPVVFTELANAPDWMEMEILLDGERFRLDNGEVLAFTRTLDIKTATIQREVRWRSPKGKTTHLKFERFASLADEHLAGVRVEITPLDYKGTIEFRAGVDGGADNLGFKHWEWLAQGMARHQAWLQCRTQATKVELVMGFHLDIRAGSHNRARFKSWDTHNHPTLVGQVNADMGETTRIVKWVTFFTGRDLKNPLASVKNKLRRMASLKWEQAWEEHRRAWENEWQKCDVVIEGDLEAQLAVRFNLFQLLVSAPRHDERVNIGAKTLSGYGYRGHSFWDTEIFMLPFFTFTRPEIAKQLLSYRWHNLPGARAKASSNGYRGAQYPWESAGTGEEVTPTWLPHPTDRTQMIRIWTGDIEIHISADIAFAIWQYWQASGDDAFMVNRGAEVILETARFWASRAEWNPEHHWYEYNNVIGPDEYHDRIDNNAYTNSLARWNLLTAIKIYGWLEQTSPAAWRRLRRRLALKPAELKDWQSIAGQICILFDSQTRLIEQFAGYFSLKDVNLETLEPRNQSVQALLGIDGVAKTQVLKQPDVLMLLYLLPDLYDHATLSANCHYYTPRTDHTFGSSLGPSIQSIMASRMGNVKEAYVHFMRAARADLFDVRGNAGDGIHGASAGGLWQAVVFGFAGLHCTAQGWQVSPALPPQWTRLAFKIVSNGETTEFDLRPPAIRAFLFDLDGVLTDTSEYHYQGWQRLADEEGLPFSRQDNEALRGVSRRESLNILLKGKQIDDATAAAWMERKNNYYIELVSHMTPRDILPGALDLLKELRDAGIKIAIASSSKNAPLALSRLKLEPYIDAVVDGNTIERSKPAPDLFLAAAKAVGAEPAECVVVEDAAAGIEAGQAAGMRTLGLGPVERVGSADMVLPSLKHVHLADVLQALK